MNYILERLRERSTWAGIVAFLAGVGVAVKPELAESIIAAGAAIGGLIYAATKG